MDNTGQIRRYVVEGSEDQIRNRRRSHLVDAAETNSASLSQFPLSEVALADVRDKAETRHILFIEGKWRAEKGLILPPPTSPHAKDGSGSETASHYFLLAARFEASSSGQLMIVRVPRSGRVMRAVSELFCGRFYVF
jgi:hypothetical protein